MSEEKQSETETNTEKKGGNVLVSILALIAILLAVIYLMPMVNEYLQNRSQTDEETPISESLEKDTNQADVPESLKTWYPLVVDALKKTESDYEVKHMRLNNDRTKLLLDLLRTEAPSESLEVILVRDEFGRYTCSHPKFKFHIYPVKDNREGE